MEKTVIKDRLGCWSIDGIDYDRLTRGLEGNEIVTLMRVLKRLADYESTGLSPKRITMLKARASTDQIIKEEPFGITADVERFIEHYCLIGDEKKCFRTDLYGAYKDYHEQHGLKPASQTIFNAVIESYGIKRGLDAETRRSIWKGIDLSHENEKKDGEYE